MFSCPMLRPLLILVAVAISAVPAAPAAAQQPRRTPPPRRRPPPVTAHRIPTPRSVLGFEPGDDRKLADWPTLVRYYQALAAASDRMRYRELGHSTLGAPLIALVISSPRNLRELDRYRALNAKLADPRALKTAREAEEVLRDGKTVVLVTSGIHSTEVGGHLTPALLAYRLASDTSLTTRTILDNVILWLVPSLNPDGVSIVTHWYNRTLGTAAEGSEPPELYHHYTGHDNNRDWYAFTQVETQLVVDSLHNVWHPQIVHDIHQQDTDGSRLFLPPYLDPIEPNVDPLLVDGVNALGTAMAWALAGQGKTGIVINAVYDAWTPARAYQHYHGGVRILSEAASANLASPLDLPADLDQGLVEAAEGGLGEQPRLEQDDFRQALIDRLLDRATLVTPNRHEAERLSGLPIGNVESMEAAARAIRRLGPEAVLVKGGHLTGPLVDVFFDGRRMVRLSGRRYRKSLHGAGCTLAASTAAYLALGHPLLESIRRARIIVVLQAFEALFVQRDRFNVGRSPGWHVWI